MMNALNKALEVNLNFLEADGNPLMEIAQTESWNNAKAFFKAEIMQSDDAELLKNITMKFDGYEFFNATEDRLCELMGEDEYFDWADENLD